MNREKKVEAILVIVIGFLVLYLIFDKSWMMWTSVLVGGLSLISNHIMNAITWGWFKLAYLLGNYVTGPILLGIVFYVFLFPLALLARFFSKDHLTLKKKGTSYFLDRNHLYTAKDIENVW